MPAINSYGDDFKFLIYIAAQRLLKKDALRLDATTDSDIQKAAKILKKGGIIAFPFNGVFGLFGDIDNPIAAKKIIRAKNRPRDKNLIVVEEPEQVHKLILLEKMPHEINNLINLLKDVHALGVIVPASKGVPFHLTRNNGQLSTVLAIWTEYPPLRKLMKYFKAEGGRALVGTSANKSGQPTHFEASLLWNEFKKDVDAVIEADFSHLEEFRKKSTTIVDLTEQTPILARLGNLEEVELNSSVKKHGFPTLKKGNFTVVKKRT